MDYFVLLWAHLLMGYWIWRDRKEVRCSEYWLVRIIYYLVCFVECACLLLAV